jgi:hypothetical protein
MYYKHGLGHTRLYHVWKSMLCRCYSKNIKVYRHYGGRGIKVYNRWHNFLVFKTWAENNGYQEKLQIDRINNNKGYYPSNCRFVTCKVNNNNTRNNHKIIIFGEEKTIAEWSRDKRCKVSYKTLLSRINDHNFNYEYAIIAPLRTDKTYKAMA